MKRVILSSLKILSIFTISIFILIPSIKAGTKSKTTTYNNYYFFVKSNNNLGQECVSGNCKMTLDGSISETAFYPPKLGIDIDSESHKKICLVKTNEEKQNSTCSETWTYQEFYKNLRTVENDGKKNEYTISVPEADFNGNDTEKDNQCDENGQCTLQCATKYKLDEYNRNNTYYSHGCYKDNRGWNQVSTVASFDYNNYTDIQLACASIDENPTAAINAKTDSDGRNYIYAMVTRNGTNGKPISTQPSLSKEDNTSNCDGEINVLNMKYRNDDSDNSELLSPALYKYSYDITTYSCVDDHEEPELKCNSSSGDYTIKTNCDRLTINEDKVFADVSISESANIVNILTPTSTYQGGGFKFGFIYYNTVSWNYYNGGEKQGEISKIPGIMKGKLKDPEEMASSIFTDVSFGGKRIDNSLMQKKCSRSGNFTEGETVTTICTIFLPNSNVEMGTGKVDYNNSKYPNYGINNQYYTPLTFTGDYQVSATLSGLNVLKENQDDGIDDWTMTFDDPTTCKINVTSRLYDENPTNDKSASYKFIYRPINLNDPFPNRNAGVNWYEWYSKDSNKKRLQESYSKLQYQVTLDNQTVTKIKEYNANRNYLDWKDIVNGKSKFVDTYFNTKRENLGGAS